MPHMFEDAGERRNAAVRLTNTVAGRRRERPNQWPTPGELFFETGVVLAVALGAAVLVELLLPALQISTA
jgi:hypothetical protein